MIRECDLITALLYATDPRRPIQQIHEVTRTIGFWQRWLNGEKEAFVSTKVVQNIAEHFWGGKIAADFSTYEGKALAAKKIQDRSFAKESLILCDFLWPVTFTKFSQDHFGDSTLESQLFSAITGKETDEINLNLAGERIFNLQRAILMREGWGGRPGDKLMDVIHEQPLEYAKPKGQFNVPGKDGQVLSTKGRVLEKSAFEKMKDEYYELRGWDVPTGLQKRSKLDELGLQELTGELAARGLLK